MSRYEIPARSPDRYKVVVGWDPMLNTFFAEVWNVEEKKKNEEAESLLMVGAEPSQIHDLEELKRYMGAYAAIPYETELKLRVDAD